MAQLLGRHYKPYLFVIVLILMVLKGPGLLIHPRIWAEETLYLNYALSHKLLDSLIYSKPSLGYYLLTANVGTTLAAIASKIFGLLYAPAVTTYFSLLIQLMPFALLVWGKSHLLRSPLLVAAGCMLMLLAPTASGEIWLSTIHTKSWTGLAAFILLFEDTAEWSKSKVWCFRLLILFFGLSGPYAAILSPVFFLAFLIYREREKLIYSLVLGGCCFLHLLVSIHEAGSAAMASRTNSFTGDSAIVNVFVFQVVWAFLGGHAIGFVDRIGLADSIQKSMAVPRSSPVVLAALLCALATFCLLKIFWTKLRSEQTLLIAVFLLLAAFTALTSLDGIPHNRYTLLPGLAILLLLLGEWNEHRKWRRGLAAVLLACSLLFGILNYRTFWIEFSAGQPSWSNEVAKWRVDGSYSPAVWPSFWPGRLDWHPKNPK